jgi:tetratricopeptide (TPR) repeat protein
MIICKPAGPWRTFTLSPRERGSDSDGERRISLYQAWCWFFREAVKERPRVFQIYVAETLAALKQQNSLAPRERAQNQAEPTLADFGDYLTAEFADLKHWLESRFDRLDGQLKTVIDTQAQHTGLLHAIRAEIGGFPALWRASRALRVGLVVFALLVSGGLGYVVWQNRQMSDVVMRQGFDTRAKLEEIIAATRQPSSARESLTPQQRYDQALQEVAFKHDLQPNELRAAIDAWTHKVKADPKSSPYDLALAEYQANHFEQAAAEAGKAYDQAMRAKVQATQDAIHAARLEGDAYEAQGHYDRALAAYRKGAALTDRAKEPLAWAEEQNRVANMLWHLARYQEAESILRDILVLREQQHGANHPQTATALNNLAWLLKTTNRLAEAEPLMRRALAIDEKSLGAEHPNVARDLNNLAQLLKATNRLAEAEPLMRRALAIDEKSYGPEHPVVARDLNNLATLLQDTNRLAEAEPLMRRALAIDEKSLGAEHPNVAHALNNLAQLLQATNRLAEAEPLMRRALAVDEKSYGPEHPNVATALNNLALLLQATNRLAEAEPLMRRALAIDEKSHGLEHPAVAIRLNNLATLLLATNRPADAEPLMRRALAIDEKSYGPEHPAVARDLNNLAQLLQATNRLAEAESLMRRALAIDEKSYGPAHPDVARDLNNLVTLMYATNRLAEAEPLERRAVLIMLKSTRAAGHELPNLRQAYANYQSLLAAQKQKPLAIAQRLDSLGPEAGYTAEEWAAMQAGWKRP